MIESNAYVVIVRRSAKVAAVRALISTVSINGSPPVRALVNIVVALRIYVRSQATVVIGCDGGPSSWSRVVESATNHCRSGRLPIPGHLTVSVHAMSIAVEDCAAHSQVSRCTSTLSMVDPSEHLLTLHSLDTERNGFKSFDGQL